MLSLIPLPYRVLAAVVLASGLYGFGYFAGNKACRTAADAERVRAVEAQMAETLKEIDRGNEIAKRLAESQQRLGRLALRHSGASSRLAVCGAPPALFVGLHNAAAQGTDLPETPSLAACTPAAVGYDTVARTVTANYSACNEYIQQLQSLIDFEEGRP